MSDYTNFLAMVSTEFHRYLMENDEFGNDIPANALVVFQVEGEDDFNNWQKEMSVIMGSTCREGLSRSYASQISPSDAQELPSA